MGLSFDEIKSKVTGQQRSGKESFDEIKARVSKMNMTSSLTADDVNNWFKKSSELAEKTNQYLSETNTTRCPPNWAIIPEDWGAFPPGSGTRRPIGETAPLGSWIPPFPRTRKSWRSSGLSWTRRATSGIKKRFIPYYPNGSRSKTRSRR